MIPLRASGSRSAYAVTSRELVGMQVKISLSDRTDYR